MTAKEAGRPERPRSAGAGEHHEPAGAVERSRLLKTWAIEAGFDRAGVARLLPSEHGELFVDWLERGDHAEMAYLERKREQRLDPRKLLPGSRSVLCVALHYHRIAGERQVEGDVWPRVARYARGEDYHLLMGERLARLGRRISAAFPGCRTRHYVDTGPLLERELAQRAGLGRIGKNTNLLHREGSWFFLGELLLTLELEPDEELSDMCGSCTRCLDACPTGALPEPYRLDSRRCISYWTIEHRGAIPEPVRPFLEDWIFGCDVCQEVCPWNHRVEAYPHQELGLGARRSELTLAGLLRLGREEYSERFRRSPMKRAKLEGLQRNAAITLGLAPSDDTDELVLALRDSPPTVRRHVAWALGSQGTTTARRGLREALFSEPEATVRSEILRALAAASASAAAAPRSC